jgi:hypothetical protein
MQFYINNRRVSAVSTISDFNQMMDFNERLQKPRYFQQYGAANTSRDNQRSVIQSQKLSELSYGNLAHQDSTMNASASSLCTELSDSSPVLVVYQEQTVTYRRERFNN